MLKNALKNLSDAKGFRAACLIGLGLLTLLLRIWAAGPAYPCPGDGGHFIQYGIEYAQDPTTMSTYWSQGMIWLVAQFVGSESMILFSLQDVNVVLGSLLVLLIAILTYRLFGFAVAVLAGFLGAVNPVLVRYAVNSYSETPFMFFVMAGLLIFCWSRKINSWAAIPVGLSLGLAGVFKSLDAFVWVALLTVLVVIWKQGRVSKKLCYVGLLFVFFVVGVFPVLSLTHERSGHWGLGSKGPINFALGPDWKNSKVVYGLKGLSREQYATAELEGVPNSREILDRIIQVEKDGVVLYMLKHPVFTAKRLIGNGVHAFRIYSGFLFMKGFRAGTVMVGLFVLALFLTVVWFETDYWSWVPILLLFVFVTTAICLNFVHERLILECLPLLIILLSRGLYIATKKMSSLGQSIMVMGCALYCLTMASYGGEVYRDEFIYWRYENLAQVGRKLSSLTLPDDTIMCYGPHLMLHTLPENPLRAVTMPYGSPARVAAYADKTGCSMISISSAWRAHWPITKVFDGEPLPGWKRLAEFTCEGDDQYMIPQEQIWVYVKDNDNRDAIPPQTFSRKPIRKIIAQ